MVPCRKNGRQLDGSHLPPELPMHKESGTSSHFGAPPQRNPPRPGRLVHPSVLPHTPVWFWTSPPSWCWVDTQSLVFWPWSPPPCHQWPRSEPLHSLDWKIKCLFQKIWFSANTIIMYMYQDILRNAASLMGR